MKYLYINEKNYLDNSYQNLLFFMINDEDLD
jgi:hypothetical protein